MKVIKTSLKATQNQLSIYLLMLFMLTFLQGFGQSREEKQVQKAFEAYTLAVNEKNGPEALKYVNQNTIQYYTQTIALAKVAPKSALTSLPIMETCLVLTVRARYTYDQIQNLTSEQLLQDQLQKGNSNRDHLRLNDLGTIAVTGEVAKAEILSDGKFSGFYLTFSKEKDVWKIDLPSLYNMSGALLKLTLQDHNLTTDSYLERYIPMTTGIPFSPELWNPPLSDSN